MKKSRIFIILFSICSLGNNLIHAQLIQKAPLLPIGFREIGLTQLKQICIPSDRYSELWEALDSSQKKDGNFFDNKYPLFDWPLENALHDELILVNYVDDDNTALIKDYMGNPHSYNGHNGTDMTLYNFRKMDQGMRVLAAAGGTVVQTEYSRYDRNTGPPYPDDGNYIIIEHDDGTFCWYWHFRKNSLTVEEGEAIQAEQILGLVGSSGYSTDAHLHFETGEYISSVWTKRDPWNGTYNPLPSLWKSQEPYIGTAPLRIYDMGVFTQAAAGGDLSDIPIELFKERITQPIVMGADEPFIAVWLQFQGQAGDPYKLEILRPDNSVYSSVNYSLSTKLRYGWHYWYWNFSGNVPPSDYGIWTARIVIDEIVVHQVNFEVDSTTEYAPRFWPIAGRSFRINGIVQRDTLRVSPLGGSVYYSLLNAPDFVTLVDDSVVTIGGASTQSYRSLYFEATATDAEERQDTMWYHIVDPSKPLDGSPDAVDDLLATLVDGSKSTSGDLLLTWTEPYSEAGVSFYVVYRSGQPSETGDSLAWTAETEYTDVGVVGDTLVNHFYTIKAVDVVGRKSPPSNQVGEFDIQLIVSEKASSKRDLLRRE